MTIDIENAIKSVIHDKTEWCKETMMILSCVSQDSKYVVKAYCPSWDRCDTPETFEISLTELQARLN